VRRVPGDAGNPTQLLTTSEAPSTSRDAHSRPSTSAPCSRSQVEQGDPGLLSHTGLPKHGPAAWGDPAAFPAQAGSVTCRGTSAPTAPSGRFSFRCHVLGMKEEHNLLFLVTLISHVLFSTSAPQHDQAHPRLPRGGLFVPSHRLGWEPHVHRKPMKPGPERTLEVPRGTLTLSTVATRSHPGSRPLTLLITGPQKGLDRKGPSKIIQSTASLGSLGQRLTTLRAENFFPMSKAHDPQV